MPYIVTNSDGTRTITVQDNVIDNSTYSLALVGRHTSNFGQYIAQNTIRHLENFASDIAPAPDTTLTGQIWFDKGDRVLRVFDGTQWKRATGITVGNVAPSDALSGGGTAFFDTKNNKLTVHNGNSFRDASYAGEVTNVYSSASELDNPAFYGSRVRTLFLTDINGIRHPVLAFSYVKSTAAGSSDVSSPNRGTTLIGQQYETIMALISDSEFIVRSSAQGGTATPVDGTDVDFTPELIADGTGIASVRSGRIQGKILKGINIRAEYEDTGVASIQTLFANIIGTPTEPVDTMEIQTLNVQDEINVPTGIISASAINVDGVAVQAIKHTTTAADKTLATNEKCLVTASGRTITLPPVPAAGDFVSVVVENFSDTVINRNGSTIMELAENFTVDKPYATVNFTYMDSSWRIG